MTHVRVILVDDHGLVRAGIRALLESIAGVEVVGEANDGVTALHLMERVSPDLVLMDVSMPGLNGLEAARRAHELHPAIRVLMVSMHGEEEYVHEALRAGAVGYLLKSADRAELEAAVQHVARGGLWLSPAISHTTIETLLQGRAGPASKGKGASDDKLTSRQREILQLIAEGNSTKQIAARLQISVKTVESHRAQVMLRLNIRNVAGLVHYAIRSGIVAST